MIKKIIKIILFLIFILGFIYMALPNPSSINQFQPLPSSVKSDLAGDTWQHPNIVAYFSNFHRSFITAFYSQNLRSDEILGKFIPPLRLNHPVEDANQYVRMYQESTFLEEYVYPFRESLFVNGYEPLVAHNNISQNKDTDFVAYNGNYYVSKTTLRYYPSKWYYRVLVYLGIWFSLILLYMLGVKVWRKKLK